VHREADRAADVAGVVRVSPDRAGGEGARGFGHYFPDSDSSCLGDFVDEGIDCCGTLACLNVDYHAAGARIRGPATDSGRYGLASKLVDGNLPLIERRCRHRYCGNVSARGSYSSRLVLRREADHQLLLGSVVPGASEGGSSSALCGRDQLGRSRFGLETFLDLRLDQAQVVLHRIRLTGHGKLWFRTGCRLGGNGDHAHDERGGHQDLHTDSPHLGAVGVR